MTAGATMIRAAMDASQSRGRRHPEPAPGRLDAYALDRHRVLHSAAFRRLDKKTQVFVTNEGDHFRTRLTHTLEVAAQARRLAEALGLNATLAETVGLAHDLGHPPFGHAGEAALAEKMARHGGFEHNVQSLRVVDFLEHPYPDYRGLNLTFELREGLLKHCTPYDRPSGAPDEARELCAGGPWPTLEAQAANLADEIAYTAHDIEDGLMHGLMEEAALQASELWRAAAAPWRARFADVPLVGIRRAVIDSLLDRLVDDAVEATSAGLTEAGVEDVDSVRGHAGLLVGFSPAMRRHLSELQAIVRESVYRHAQVARMDEEARRVVGRLFDAYAADPRLLTPRFASRVSEQGVQRVVCDYIAGMTDRFCRAEFGRLCGPE